MKEEYKDLPLSNYIILSTYDGTIGFTIFVDGKYVEGDMLEEFLHMYDSIYYGYTKEYNEEYFFKHLCITFKKDYVIHCIDGGIDFIKMEV